MNKHFLAVTDLSTAEIFDTLAFAQALKAKHRRREPHKLLEGKTLAMIFQKPSTRTRVSFEVGMFHLGGHALYFGPDALQMGKRESIADLARALSRYVDVIMARLFGHKDLLELAEYATVPVINGLTDLLHPCQVMADILTIMEKRGHLDNLKIAYIGDGNNMANSWINMAAKIPMTLHLATPEGYEPDADIVSAASQTRLSDIHIVREPAHAAKEANVIYTDVWVSLGQEAETAARNMVFQPYQVNRDLLQVAAADCLVMHGLPAHRGEEITDDVIDGPHSIVFDEAENRLHVQKAILVRLLQNAEL